MTSSPARMTLHRRQITLPGVVAGLSLRAAAQLREALFPVLSRTGPAAERLHDALDAIFDLADRHLPLLAGLFSDDAGVFHAAPDASGALPSGEVFVAPFVKLLADGEGDGTVLRQQDRVETATALFNIAGWGYVQLRHPPRPGGTRRHSWEPVRHLGLASRPSRRERARGIRCAGSESLKL